MMTTSALLRHGPGHAMVLLGGLIEWMARQGFATLDGLRGLLALSLDPGEAETELRRVPARSCKTGRSLPGYPKVTFRNSTRPAVRAGRTRCGGSVIAGSVPSTCPNGRSSARSCGRGPDTTQRTCALSLQVGVRYVISVRARL